MVMERQVFRMEFASVFHRATDNYCYALDENQLIINIKTGYDVKEVNTGYECGIMFEKYSDIKEGDVIEAFIMEEIVRN